MVLSLLVTLATAGGPNIDTAIAVIRAKGAPSPTQLSPVQIDAPGGSKIVKLPFTNASLYLQCEARTALVTLSENSEFGIVMLGMLTSVNGVSVLMTDEDHNGVPEHAISLTDNAELRPPSPEDQSTYSKTLGCVAALK